MTSPVLNEQFYADAFIVSEAENRRSRVGGLMENTTATALDYPAGLIVSLNAGAHTSSAGGNTGNGTIGALSQGGGVQFGSYVLTAKSATDFAVVAPTGDALPDATVGSAYTGPLNFLLTAGSTAFAAGDSFTVAINQTAGNSWSSWTGAAYVVGAGSASHPTNTGNGTVGGISPGPAVKIGTYTLTAKSATDFGVVSPFGAVLPDATVGTAYAGDLGFLVTAGSTSYAAGDVLTVTFNQLGILADRTHIGAASATKVAVLVRACEVNAGNVQWDPVVTANAAAASLQSVALALLAASQITAR